MATNRRTVQAPVDAVWNVLSDGWLYPLWVVGASRMRGVDDGWPAIGSRLHHSVGLWPALIDDYTEVRDLEPSRMLLLRARAWPIGDATVRITLQPEGDSTFVTIGEDARSGPSRLVPRPLRTLGLRWRNTESLLRLAALAENR